MPTVHRSHSIGFTLIELLIVIAIITIVTGATIPSFNTYINNQNTRQALEQIKDDLRTVQNRVLNGQNSTSLVNGSKPLYWMVSFTSGQGDYEYFLSVNNNTCNANPFRLSMGMSGKLPGENVIRSSSGCVFFNFESADASFQPAAISTVIVGPSAGANVCRRLIISANGLITVNSANVSCT